ncbi:hypothetical protein [Pantoea sp. S62]|uniref:hypothetical protein n=1 Tax=Pantoea sp. S62 TaxID=2769342 RepID=UPI00191316BE|nr:hypothetical protein [Pantoea sp. S62]MBK5013055.1 hypothetical protein [Pantoea sp. S62]
MVLINGLTDGVANSYVASGAIKSSSGDNTESITGKRLPDTVVIISQEARDRLMQVVTEPVSAEQQDKTLNDLLASRSAHQGPTFNLGYALFNDPYTNWDARTFRPLLDMTTDNTQASMDEFAGALHQVLAEGQVGQNQYDNSDTSEAMAITLMQVKLHKLIEKYVPDDKRKQATGIVDEMIDGKVAFREERTLLGAQQRLDIAHQYGTREIVADARDYLTQVKSGSARPQNELARMFEATKSGSDMNAIFSVFADVIRSTPNPDNKAQPSIDDALKQLEIYRQQWQAFADKYIA